MAHLPPFFSEAPAVEVLSWNFATFGDSVVDFAGLSQLQFFVVILSMKMPVGSFGMASWVKIGWIPFTK